MSNIRIGVVSEGITDFILIEAILDVCLPDKDFTLIRLQPEPTYPLHGEGWGGICRWASRAISQNNFSSLDEYIQNMPNPLDAIIIQIDIDVLGMNYSQANLELDANWLSLPIATDPPISNSDTQLTEVLKSWLSPTHLGRKSILCFPAQSIETWLAAAIWGSSIPYNPPLNVSEYTTIDLETNRPKVLKIKKNRNEYYSKVEIFKANWSQVKQICSQAISFENNILNILK